MDMQIQLRLEHEKCLKGEKDDPIVKVYRGQLMTREEVICLEKFTGFTYSMNSFLSTTRQR